jgi:hypothetical protein
MKKYEDVVLLQGDDADEALTIIHDMGVDMGMEHLQQWNYGEPTDGGAQHCDGYPNLMFHSNFYYEDGGYVLGYNYAFTVVALWRVTEHADYPHEPNMLYDCPACEVE